MCCEVGNSHKGGTMCQESAARPGAAEEQERGLLTSKATLKELARKTTLIPSATPEAQDDAKKAMQPAGEWPLLQLGSA